MYFVLINTVFSNSKLNQTLEAKNLTGLEPEGFK